MGFDLYFAGGSSPEAEKTFAELNCNRLFSWLEGRNVNKCIDAGNKGKLFIDSGAYSAWTRGVQIDIDKYIEFVNERDEYLTIFADLDVITLQPKTIEDFIRADVNAQTSWNNYLYMRKHVKSPDKLLPVFHQWENYKWLRNMLEWTDENGKHIPYIGLSPKLDNSMDKRNFLSECFKIIKSSSNPNVKTHAFGMTALNVLEQFPLTSADSTTWVMVASFGRILTPYGVVLVSDAQENDLEHIKHMPEEARRRVVQNIESHGLTLEQVMSSYKYRTIQNISYLKEWSDNYVYKPTLLKGSGRTLF